jgi:hypothetical protein
VSAGATAQGACSDRLDLVDAAFDRPGGPAARELAERVCPTCPIWRECLYAALDSGEHGVWGGANERTRRRHVKRPPTYNLRAVDRGMVDGVTQTGAQPTSNRLSDRRITQMADLGVTSAQVRGWAYDHGIPVTPSGLPSLDVIDAYAQAQRAA